MRASPLALTRAISPSIDRCELTHLARESIDLEKARAQHVEYERCLSNLGCRIIRLPPEPDMPDSVFVEDMAVVLDELAVITRPGAESRRGESASVERVLRMHRTLAYIEEPGTLDGGDVLQVGSTLYVGASERTNPEGISQLAHLISPHGYDVVPVSVTGCLHLKSGVTAVGDDLLLINREWVDAGAFSGLGLIDVAPEEPMAANALCILDSVVFPYAFCRTRVLLERSGLRVQAVDVSELAKAEGGVTCCSLIVRPSR